MEERARLEAERYENSLSRAVEALEVAWMDAGVGYHHQFVVKEVLNDLDQNTFHKVCVTEIRLAESLGTPSLRIDKYFGMHRRCLQKITDLNGRFKLYFAANDEEVLGEVREEVA